MVMPCGVGWCGVGWWCGVGVGWPADSDTHPNKPINTINQQVEALYGVTRTREVYGKAIESLPDEGAKNMCLEFAEVERKLGEVRRGWGGGRGDGACMAFHRSSTHKAHHRHCHDHYPCTHTCPHAHPHRLTARAPSSRTDPTTPTPSGTRASGRSGKTLR